MVLQFGSNQWCIGKGEYIIKSCFYVCDDGIYPPMRFSVSCLACHQRWMSHWCNVRWCHTSSWLRVLTVYAFETMFYKQWCQPDFTAIISCIFTSLLIHLIIYPVWHRWGHFYPLLLYESDFVSWFFPKIPNFLGGENWYQLGYFDTLHNSLSLLKVAPRWH